MHLQIKDFINKNILFLIVELFDVSELFHHVETTRIHVHVQYITILACVLSSTIYSTCTLHLFQTATHSEEVQGIRMEYTEH